MSIADLRNCPLSGRTYGGDGGNKYGILIDGEKWLVKFPKTTEGMKKVQLSYTTTPASEYLGSQIYELLDIPVHKTLLGERDGKIAVACKDFVNYESGESLEEFKNIKNMYGVEVGGSSTSGANTDIDEVLEIISDAPLLKGINGINERFWLMFAVDALIGNNDRHNMNWGFIQKPNNERRIAPVFDNGGAFFNKKDEAKMSASLQNPKQLEREVLELLECAFAKDGKRIRPFVDDLSGYSDDLVKALDYVLGRLPDIEPKIEQLITEIPESYNDMQVLPKHAKEYYIKSIQIRADRFVEIRASLPKY